MGRLASLRRPTALTLHTMKIIIFSLLIFTLTACSNDSDLQLVTQFVKGDFHGERLGGGAKGLMNLVNWNDEPGWDEVMMVSDYKIQKDENGVSVTFTTHGYCPNGEFTAPNTKSYTFNTINKNGRMVISEPLYTPHVSREVACNRFPHCCAQGM